LIGKFSQKREGGGEKKEMGKRKNDERQGKKKKDSSSEPAVKKDDELDTRFAGLSKDPRFRRLPRDARKVAIGSRFSSLFHDEEFTTHSSRDKYGRKVHRPKTNEEYSRFYHIEDDEGEKEKEGEDGAVLPPVPSNVIYGEGLASSSDSEHSSDLSDDEVDETESEQEEVPTAGEEDISNRIAVMGCDWAKVTAVDLLVIFQSFVPRGGSIVSVTIFPSNFGLERMAEEDTNGPVAILKKIAQKLKRNQKGGGRGKGEEENESDGGSDEDSDEDSDDEEEEMGEDERKEFDKLVAKEYEDSKLLYYYAVVVCDSKQTANAIYSECDGLEIEKSSNLLDLRFVPPDTEFENEPKEVAKDVPVTYSAPDWYTQALQHTDVKLTWDDDPIDRKKLRRGKFSVQDDADEDEVRKYLASSGESSGSESDDEGDSKSTAIRSILLGEDLGMETGMRKEEEDEGVSSSGGEEGGMEMTFNPKLMDVAENAAKKALAAPVSPQETLTPFEKYTEKVKARKSERKQAKKHLIQQQEEEQRRLLEEEKRNKKKKTRGNRANAPQSLDAEDIRKQKELELLLMEDTLGDKPAKKGFHMDALLVEAEAADSSLVQRKKRGKKKDKQKKEEAEQFEVDLEDDRFQRLFYDAEFAIDPTNPKFVEKHTQGMKQIQEEAQRRRRKRTESNGVTQPSKKRKTDGSGSEMNIEALVKSVKAKSKNITTQQ